MREIKFRARITWTPAETVGEVTEFVYFTLSDLAESDKFSIRQLVIPWLIAGNEPDRFTGLHDKDGTEIYEGDKVMNDSPYPNECWIAAVGWDVDAGCWSIRDPNSESFDDRLSDFTGGQYLRVIGNIYENPELLS